MLSIMFNENSQEISEPEKVKPVLPPEIEAKVISGIRYAFGSSISFLFCYFFIQLYLRKETVLQVFSSFAPESLKASVAMLVFFIFITAYSLAKRIAKPIQPTDKAIFLTSYISTLGLTLAPLLALLTLFSIFLNINMDIFLK